MSEITALQTTLAAEHAAVYVLGVLGGQTSQSGAPALFTAVSGAYVAHRGQRDQLVRAIGDRGATPVPAEVAYAVPADLGTPAAVARRALRLERDCAATYSYLVASSTGDLRAWGLRALQAGAVRALGFGGSPEILPGRTEV